MFNLIKETFKPKHLKKASLLVVLMLFLTFSGCSFNNKSSLTASSQVSTTSSLAVSTNLNSQDQVSLVAIEVNKLPTRLDYSPTEVISTSGGELRVVYSDYSVRYIPMRDSMIDESRLNMSTLGNARVSIKYTYLGKTLFTSYNINVVPFLVNLNGVSLDIVSSDVVSDQIVQLNPIYAPTNAYIFETLWTSSNPLIASVDSNGLVTPINPGEVIITVTVNNLYSAASRLNILQGEIKEVVEVVNQPVTLDPTANLTFALTTPSPSGTNIISTNQATSPKTVSINVANNTSSVVITATKLAGQTVAFSGTNSADVTAAGTSTAPTYTVSTSSVATSGGSKTFTLTVSESNKTNIIYNFTINVSEPTLLLLLDLDASNVSSYSGSGNTWTNLVDNNNFTISPSGVFDSTNGGSIVFGGSTIVALDTFLAPNTSYSYEAWVYDNPGSSGARNIISSFSNVFWINGTTLSAGVGGSYSLVTYNNFPKGVWKHVAVTFNTSTNTMVLFVDGVEESSASSVNGEVANEFLRIGAHSNAANPGSPVSFWNGRIASVKIYNYSLNLNQVMNSYNETRPRFLNTVYLRADTYSGSGDIINAVSSVNNGIMEDNVKPGFDSTYKNFIFNGSGIGTGATTKRQIKINDSPNIEPGSGSFTLEVWFKYSGSNGGSQVIVGKFDDGGLSVDVSYSIRIHGPGSVESPNVNANKVFAQFGSGSGTGASLFANSSNIPLNTVDWYHLVYVFTNTAQNKKIETFVNGVRVDIVDHFLASIRDHNNPLYIGSYNNNESAQHFNGLLREFRYYNAALTSDQVAKIYENLNQYPN
jgi:hypothetical protein